MSDLKGTTATELYKEIHALATARGFAVFDITWLRSVKAFSEQLDRSKKNIEQGGWTFIRHTGGEKGRRIEFVRMNDRAHRSG
ncbi:hypothetical protein A2529_05030 [Candidatus Peribacteria bacterium RIFOXYD2_FULL_58_15]|nr:MAG: hypothetical protein A2529_05030 [Candidatus Peribacteria bacterium RIFOXYD2_FULL_58_15]